MIDFLTAEDTEEETQRAQRVFSAPSAFPPLCPLRLKKWLIKISHYKNLKQNFRIPQDIV